MPSKIREKHFFYALLAGTAIFVGAIFWPFVPLIVIAAALAVVLHPVYARLLITANGNRWLSAFVTVVLFALVIGGPLVLVGSQVIMQSQSAYLGATNSDGFQGVSNQATVLLHRVFPATTDVDLGALLGDAASFLSSVAKTIFTATLSTSFAGIVVLISVFYFLKDGDRWRSYLLRLSPLSVEHDKRIVTMLGRAVNGVMRGYILIAIIQGALAGLGLWVFGVPNAVLWGTLAGIASMLPSIGTAFVTVPSIIYLFAVGATGPAIGLIAWSAILVGMIDNLLSPIIVGKRIELSPIIVLFSVFGGIALMGASGIIVGPLAASLLHTLIRIYQEDFETLDEASQHAR